MIESSKKRGGRVAGVPNRATVDGREKCKRYAGKALRVLVQIMENPNASEAARVKAATAILDRAWGRPIQAVEYVPPALPPTPNWTHEQTVAFFGGEEAWAKIKQQLDDEF